VLNLPASPGVAGAVLLALGLLAGGVCGVLLWRHLGVSGQAGDGRLAAATLVVALASTVAAAPFVAWRIYEDMTLNSRYTRAQAERIGGDILGIDHRAIERAARTIPPHDTYFVAAPGNLGMSRARDGRRWALTALLPRIEVYDARKADWIFAWDRDPGSVGVRVGAVTRFRLATNQPPSRFALARVVR
jgi:hypothetical protein